MLKEHPDHGDNRPGGNVGSLANHQPLGRFIPTTSCPLDVDLSKPRNRGEMPGNKGPKRQPIGSARHDDGSGEPELGHRLTPHGQKSLDHWVSETLRSPDGRDRKNRYCHRHNRVSCRPDQHPHTQNENQSDEDYPLGEDDDCVPSDGLPLFSIRLNRERKTESHVGHENRVDSEIQSLGTTLRQTENLWACVDPRHGYLKPEKKPDHARPPGRW